MTLSKAVTETAGQAATVRVGKVLSTSPLQIDLGGTLMDLTALGSLGSYVFAEGDTVILLGQSVEGASTSGSTWVAIGASVNSQAGLLAQNGLQIAAAVQSTSSAAYADITNLEFTFTKRRTGTRIDARFFGSAFASVVGGGVETAAQINGVDYLVASSFFNVASDHRGYAGEVFIPAGIPAGSYTVKGRWRRYTGGGNIQTDSNDRLSLHLEECW